MLRLRQIREQRELSLRDLGTQTGIASGDLSLIERGLKPAWPGWRKRLSRVLGTPEEILFNQATDPETEAATK